MKEGVPKTYHDCMHVNRVSEDLKTLLVLGTGSVVLEEINLRCDWAPRALGTVNKMAPWVPLLPPALSSSS